MNDDAVIFHALATNAARYGALSGGGTLRLRGGTDGADPCPIWEAGVASSGADKAHGTGFGSRLLEQTIDAGGLRFAMTVPIR